MREREREGEKDWKKENARWGGGKRQSERKKNWKEKKTQIDTVKEEDWRIEER